MKIHHPHPELLPEHDASRRLLVSALSQFAASMAEQGDYALLPDANGLFIRDADTCEYRILEKDEMGYTGRQPLFICFHTAPTASAATVGELCAKLSKELRRIKAKDIEIVQTKDRVYVSLASFASGMGLQERKELMATLSRRKAMRQMGIMGAGFVTAPTLILHGADTQGAFEKKPDISPEQNLVSIGEIAIGATLISAMFARPMRQSRHLLQHHEFDAPNIRASFERMLCKQLGLPSPEQAEGMAR